MQGIYSSCRFGLFPNITDCSPRMISECFVHNVPVMVNKDILGGWKYIVPETGIFFDKGIRKADVNNFLKQKYSPRT